MSRLSVLACIITTGAILGAAAIAGSAGAATTSVAFDGANLLGLPLLSCASEPSSSSVSLRAGDVLTLENKTGHAAIIYVNGATATNNANVGSSSAAPITFPVGTWTVALVPTCLPNLDDADPVTVHVSATPSSAATIAAGGTTDDSDPFQTAGPATTESIDAGSVAIGPAVSLDDGDSQSPNYLLVVLTAIGIIGVGAAAVRALLAQRTLRSAY